MNASPLLLRSSAPKNFRAWAASASASRTCASRKGKRELRRRYQAAGHAAWRLPSLEPRPCAHRQDRHVQGEGAAGRRRGADRRRSERRQSRLDADPRRRRADGARRRQSAVPEPGDRLRRRDRPLYRRRRGRPRRGRIRSRCRSSSIRSRPWTPDAPILREDIKDKTEGAHGPRKHPNHIFNWAVGDRELTDAAFAKAEVATKDLLSYQRVHPCPLETCQCVVSFNKITGDLTIYGTFQAPHVIRTVVALISGLPEQKIHVDLARHRRRLRQQGRRLSGLHLRGGRLDRDGRAGQMGRGPDRESLDDLFRPRLSHDDRNRGDERGPRHCACACISSPITAPSTPAPIRRNGRRASPTSSPAPTTSRSRISRSTASTPTRRRAASPIAARSG